MQLPSPSARTVAGCSLFAAILATPALATSCAHAGSAGGLDDAGPGSLISTGSGSGSGSGPGSGNGGVIVMPPPGANCTKDRPCDDFPAKPVMDPGGMPASDPSNLFGGPGTGSTQGGPCLAEPADGALFPKNWLRPRILWSGLGQGAVYEVRVHSDGERNDLVVYTTNTYWVMDVGIWQTIAWQPAAGGGIPKDGSLVGGSFTVTVRGVKAGGGGPVLSNSATVTIAPALADGALIYWTTSSFANVSNNTTLQGFHVGDEGTTTALTANQVQQQVRAQSVDGGNVLPASYNQDFCIGCHTATPDGDYVSFTSQWPWATALASVKSGQVGQQPAWLTQGAISNLSPNINGYYRPPTVNQVMMGIQTFSPAHYKQGDRRIVAAIGATWNQTDVEIKNNAPGSPTGVVSQLVWADLEWNGTPPTGMPYNPWGPDNPNPMNASPLPLANPCTSMSGVACATPGMPGGGWGVIARNGDNNSAGAPSWSHNANGMTDLIAYASTNLGTKDGRMDCEHSGPSCTADVYVVPYNGGMGGTARPLPGASDPGQSEYYPSWSPDDQFIAFNRVPTGVSMYNEPQADVYVVPYNGGMGGTGVRLKANDPVACTGAAPNTVQNTWPKWAPNPLDPSTKKPVPQKDAAGNTYYWLTFSSIRNPLSPPDAANKNKRRQQLYVVGIVVGAGGAINASFSPIYLWNQDYTVNNLIPAWEEFSIPPGLTPPPMPTAL
jgi:hypothetical protein